MVRMLIFIMNILVFMFRMFVFISLRETAKKSGSAHAAFGPGRP